MRIPKNEKALIPFVKDIISECAVSRSSRMTEYRKNRAIYYMGTTVPGQRVIYNRCYPHIHRLSAYLFSPADVRLGIKYENVYEASWFAKAERASKALTFEAHTSNIDDVFSEAVDWALIDGKSFVKLKALMKKGEGALEGQEVFSDLEGSVIQAKYMGVLREDIAELDRQEAFTYTTWITPSMLRIQLANHPNYKDIYERAVAGTQGDTNTNQFQQSEFMKEVILSYGSGGNSAMTLQGTANTNTGNAPLFSGPIATLDPEVISSLIKFEEVWIRDDERDDWTTIQFIAPDIIVEGKYQHRNLCGVKGEQPFREVCANKTNGYFWGFSEFGIVGSLQENLNRRWDDVDRLIQLAVRAPKFGSGITGISEMERNALNSPGGWFTDAQPGSKIENLSPTIPPELFSYVGKLDEMFDEVAGFKPTLSGEGSAGVRSAAHADTLVRQSSPHLRDRALLIERQFAEVGDLAFKMMQAKDARMYKAKDGSEFLLSQIPDDAKVEVDSHTSSPAFSEDTKQLALSLRKLGVIDDVDTIRLTHPQDEDVLMEKAQAKAKAQEELQQEAKKADPQGFFQSLFGKKKK